MESSSIFKRIKNDRFYLLRQYTVALVISLLAILFLSFFREDTSNLSVQGLIYVLPGILFGLVTASFLHNTAHNNIRPILLNRIIGEFCGHWVLYGYTNFSMIHLLHHAYADKEYDPVNPQGMNFLVFLTAPMRYMIKRTKEFLFNTHGHHKDYARIMTYQTAIFHLLLLTRLTAWYFILGKELFFFFYLPGYISNVAIYAHINYVCHRDQDDGSVEVVNLNHNLYYKFANFMTVGGYFHKNHHINPGLFDSRKLCPTREVMTLRTIPPKLSAPLPAVYQKNFLSEYFNLYDVWGEKEKNVVSEPFEKVFPVLGSRPLPPKESLSLPISTQIFE